MGRGVAVFLRRRPRAFSDVFERFNEETRAVSVLFPAYAKKGIDMPLRTSAI